MLQSASITPISESSDPEFIIDPAEVDSGGSFEGTKLDRFLDNVEDKAVGFVDTVTSVSDKADDFTDYLINKARSLQNRATGTAEQNLTQAKAGSYGKKAVQWVMNNSGIAAAIVIVIGILIYRK